jgi:uncharacterized membrane protein
MKKYLKEVLLLVFAAIPYVYLYSIWNSLPAKVPTHFNLEGVADDWSGKNLLLFLPCGMGIGIYLLMLIFPLIDPKKKIQQMGDKYYSLRLLLTFFLSAVGMYILYASKEGELKNPKLLMALIAALVAALGNYFQTLRPNYFIGIRTPWTLGNEEVWKKTHRLGGRLWMAGGILIIIFSFIISSKFVFAITFITLILIMVIIPVVFSYLEFKKEKNLLIQK